MATQLRDFGVDELDLGAAIQCVLLQKALYAGRIDAIAPLLLPGGSLVASHLSHETWPPSYVVLRCGPDDWFFAAEGTTSLWGQLGWHIWGSYNVNDSAGPDAVSSWTAVHGAWASAAATILPVLLSASGTGGPPKKWRLTGHSYGGAVAQLLAEQLKAQFPAWDVSLLVTAAPKPRSAGYGGPRPSPQWSLQSTGDQVPSLPIPGIYPNSERAWFDPGFRASYIGWRQYLDVVIMNQSGDWNAQGDGTATDPLVTRVPPYTHFVNNYAGRLRTRFNRLGGPPEAAQAFDLYAALAEQPNQAPQAAGLPTWLPGPSGSRVPNPFYYAPNHVPPLSNRSPEMANPVVSTNIYKMTCLINQEQDDAGWRESFFLDFGSTAPSETQLQAAINAYTVPRLASLNSKAAIVAFRTQRLTPKGRSRLWEDSAIITIGDGATQQPRSDPAVVAIFHTRDVSGEVRGQMNFRGLNAVQGQLTTDERRRGGDPGPTLRAFVAAFTAAFIGPGPGGGAASPRALIEWTGETPTEDDSTFVENYSLNGTRLALRVDGTIDADVGDTVRLSHRRQKGIKGLNGDAVVLKVVTNTDPAGTTTYTVDMGFCGFPAALEDAIGFVRPIQRRFVALAGIFYSANSTRDTGRPFGARAARRATCN